MVVENWQNPCSCFMFTVCWPLTIGSCSETPFGHWFSSLTDLWNHCMTSRLYDMQYSWWLRESLNRRPLGIFQEEMIQVCTLSSVCTYPCSALWEYVNFKHISSWNHKLQVERILKWTSSLVFPMSLKCTDSIARLEQVNFLAWDPEIFSVGIKRQLWAMYMVLFCEALRRTWTSHPESPADSIGE